MKKFILIMILMLVLGAAFTEGQRFNVAVTDTATMTAPSYSTAVWCAGYSKLMWYFTISNINTKVAVAIQAKKGKSQWANVEADSLVYTANGNYGIEWDSVALADSVRFRFIYELGGTNTKINHNVALAGGF